MSKVSVKGILSLFLIFSLLLPATLAVDVYEEDLQPGAGHSRRKE